LDTIERTSELDPEVELFAALAAIAPSGDHISRIIEIVLREPAGERSDAQGGAGAAAPAVQVEPGR
jgi:hypothetical protein